MITWEHIGEPPLCWCFFEYAGETNEKAVVLTWREYDRRGMWEWIDYECDFWGQIICYSEITAPVFEPRKRK